jgi:Tol biopolymer transport system component
MHLPRPSVALAVLAGCGFTVAPATQGDASVDDATGDGGAIDARDIDAAVPLGPFGTITPLASLDTAGSEDDPTLTGDLLEIYFDRNSDIYFSVRATPTDPWPASQPLAIVNTTSAETTCEITPDGLELFFSSNRGGGPGGTDIYVTTRPNRAAAFGTPVMLSALASNAEDVTPTPVGNSALVMYLSSNRAGTAGGYDLWRTTRPSRAQAWTVPVHVDSLATAGTETEPWVSPSETELYYSGDGLGGRDLYLATRASVADPWSAPAAVTELNSAGTEEDPWLSPDGHTMIFSSTRAGTYDLYMATR